MRSILQEINLAWLSRSGREQVILFLLASFLMCLCMWYGALAPAWQWRQTSIERYMLAVTSQNELLDNLEKYAI